MYLFICSIHGSDIEASSSLQVKHGAVPAREENKRRTRSCAQTHCTGICICALSYITSDNTFDIQKKHSLATSNHPWVSLRYCATGQAWHLSKETRRLVNDDDDITLIHSRMAFGGGGGGEGVGFLLTSNKPVGQNSPFCSCMSSQCLSTSGPPASFLLPLTGFAGLPATTV